MDTLGRLVTQERPQDEEGSTHFFTQIPQPIHKNSEMNAILSVGLTSMHSFPARLLKELYDLDGKDRTHFHDGT